MIDDVSRLQTLQFEVRKVANTEIQSLKKKFFFRKFENFLKVMGISYSLLDLREVLWGAVPGGTAMPGQPATEVVQAPSTPSNYKNQFNILTPQCGVYQILS